MRPNTSICEITYMKLKDIFNRHDTPIEGSYGRFISQFSLDSNYNKEDLEVLRGCLKFIIEFCNLEIGYFDSRTDKCFTIKKYSDIKISFLFKLKSNIDNEYKSSKIIFDNINSLSMDTIFESDLSSREVKSIEGKLWICIICFVSSVLYHNYRSTVTTTNPKYGRWE